MSGTFKPIKITDKVYWVGAIDWRIRDFHGYSTNRGTTYNAFLVLSDKITLIDTVKSPFEKEMFARIKELVDPAKIDVVISNHAEMDHSGSLPAVLEKVKPTTFIASKMGHRALKLHFGFDKEISPVVDGDQLDLGGVTAKFVETRMVHWPDSMFTYLDEEKMLISSDGFGMHLATSERFADEISDEVLEYEGKKYYANILTPFSPLIKKLIDKVVGLNLPVEIVAPDHGPIWRTNPLKMVQYYGEWAAPKPKRQALLVFDTMWESTAKMAQAIGDGLISKGVSVKLMSLKTNHRSDIVTDLLDSAALLIGSPTLNNNLYPTVIDFLTYLKGLKIKPPLTAAFGSYGWSGEAVKQINELLGGIGGEMISDGLRVNYVPDQSALEQCFALGEQTAEKILAITG